MNVRIAPVDDWGTFSVELDDNEGWVACPRRGAREVTLSNLTGETIKVKRAGAPEDPFELPDGVTQRFPVVGNAEEVMLQRTGLTGPVKVSGVYYG